MRRGHDGLEQEYELTNSCGAIRGIKVALHSNHPGVSVTRGGGLPVAWILFVFGVHEKTLLHDVMKTGG